jgi:hypothetical protein
LNSGVALAATEVENIGGTPRTRGLRNGTNDGLASVS